MFYIFTFYITAYNEYWECQENDNTIDIWLATNVYQFLYYICAELNMCE